MLAVASFALQNYINAYVILPGILVGILLLWWMHRRRSLEYRIFFSLFWLYLLALLSMTVFSGAVYRSVPWIDRQEMVPLLLSRVNLVPLHFGRFPHPSYILNDVLLNFLVTVPLGFGLAFLVPMRARTMLVIAVGAGLFFEGGQLAISLLTALPARVTDINDAIFNALGVMLGYGLFRLFERFAARANWQKSA
jgi:glycopeptide antibiotics resistance protein